MDGRAGHQEKDAIEVLPLRRGPPPLASTRRCKILVYIGIYSRTKVNSGHRSDESGVILIGQDLGCVVKIDLARRSGCPPEDVADPTDNLRSREF